MRTKRRELKELRQGRRPAAASDEYTNSRHFGSDQLSRLESYYELVKMIAGAGVGFAGSHGVGMLRARRRDISIKPNRKLDRKSSRGVIYENEELRLRSIQFNAEVEQGQNDIKKLRRENEQLRREIWSLRDEYDKLEEILKKQKSREESDEPEGRSETEAAGSECSEDEEDDEEEEDEDDDDEEGSEFDDDDDAANDQEVRQENAENQKISSEKLSVTPIQHRTLTVVHEEEELKKEQPYVATVAVDQQPVMPQQPPPFPYHSTSFEQPYPITTTSFGSPFTFPPPALEPLDVSYSNVGGMQLMTTYPQVHHQPTTQTSSFDVGVFEHPRVASPPPPPGWQSGLSPRGSPSNFDCPSAIVKPPEEFRAPTVENPGQKSLAERRRAFFKHYSEASGSRDNSLASDKDTLDAARPRHFFAPLPAKCRSPCNGEAIRPMDDATMNGGGALSDNGNSPSSEKTGSTVISRDRYEKGSLDNGNDSRRIGMFLGNDHFRFSAEQSAEFFAADSSNGLTKSLSCQDLNSRLSFAENLGSRNEQLAKSDSTLDNMSVKAFKSQLNITLRQPGSRKSLSPDTPEIPKLPSIDYKLFNNPFLQNFEQAYQNFPMRTEGQSPLSLQVCESPVSGAGYSSPVRMQPTFTSPSEPEYAACKRRDLERLRLMIPSSSSKIFDGGERQEYQVTSFESPSPHTLQIPPMTPYELEALRRMPTGTTPLTGQSPLGQQGTPRLYQNVPFTPGMRHETPIKISTMTQTSPDDQPQESIVQATPDSTEQPKKRRSRKDKSGSIKEKGGSVKRRSPSAARRNKDQVLKKQTSVTSSSKDIPETPRSRDSEPNNNESRSSSSGQESPKKSSCEPATSKRVSLYFSARKRPSLTSSRTSRSRSVENGSRHLESGGGASERERTNSISSREATRADKQQRRTSTSSGSVPWCACWGNGCI